MYSNIDKKAIFKLKKDIPIYLTLLIISNN